MTTKVDMLPGIREEVESSSSEAVQAPGHRALLGQADVTSRTRWDEEEALRLVQNIFLLRTGEPPKVVVFAGIDHGNGCSQICASVGETLAASTGKPVCLVELNFHSPALPGLFGTLNHHSLTDGPLHKGSISELARPVGPHNLWLLSSGALEAGSFNLLTSEYLAEQLEELRQNFDFLIIDAPPMTLRSDAIVLGQRADGLVLVLEANKTRREAASAVADSLRSAGVPILAAVLNKRTFPIPASLYSRL
jgi:Mrp family chromosome partitioning ATPase